MSTSLTPTPPHLEEIEQMLRLWIDVFIRLGFKNQSSIAGDKRQITYENQIFIGENAFSLVVVTLPEVSSRTFNFEFSHLTSTSSDIFIQDRPVKKLIAQVVEKPDYRQISLQIYFKDPLNYQSEDLIFRCKVEKSPAGPQVKFGLTWIKPETHMPADVALEITRKIHELLP